MNKQIQDKIEGNNYVVTEHEVETLAAAHFACTEAAERTDGSYLKVLVAALQAQFGRTRRRKLSKEDFQAHLKLLSETQAKFYPHVLKGVTTEDCADKEGLKDEDARNRNAERVRRATFARTAASTLAGYIKAGGDIRGLNVMSVTKTGLRAWATEHSPLAAPAHARRITTILGRVEAEVRELAVESPEAALDSIGACMDRLQKIMDELSATTQARHGRTLPDVGVESAVFQGRARGRAREPARMAA
jgi:hypothetical protein